MDAVRPALKTQLHAALATLRERIVDCPDSLWTEGQFPRQYWRIAYHAIFYADLYSQNCLDDFKAWEKHSENAPSLFDDAEDLEPYTKVDLLSYLDDLICRADSLIEGAEIDRLDSGFYWYDMPKLDHLILNLRHIMEHNGQLGERLLNAGIDIHWHGGGRPKRETTS